MLLTVVACAVITFKVVFIVRDVDVLSYELSFTNMTRVYVRHVCACMRICIVFVHCP